MPLVLSRREGEYIRVYGPAIVRVHKIAGNRVKLLVEAEQGVTVLRGEILEEAAEDAIDSVPEEPLDEDYVRFVAEMAMHCRCVRGPCDGVLAGGPCDGFDEDWEEGQRQYADADCAG